MGPDLARRAVAEAVGTALLLATVVGSGIMGERLAGGNVAVALLANAVATGAGLVAFILAFGPISGAHFNPAVTLAVAARRGLAWRDVPVYLAAQVGGAFAGVAAAHLMFEEPLFSASTQARAGAAQAFGELVATFGLLAVIWGCARARSVAVPFAVGAYITAAYWFTASTSFANPAVTLARSATDTFAGVRPADVPAFVAAELVGAALATGLFHWLAAGEESKLKGVLFACVHNAGRSQMAAAFFNAQADPARARAVSAGTEPGERIHPQVVDAMREVGIDLAAARPQQLSDEIMRGADLLVTMGCGEACPYIPQLERDDWPLDDPKGRAPDEVRRIRDEIQRRVADLVRTRGWGRGQG